MATIAQQRNYELGPIFRAALRNKIGALLIALQTAFTMAVVVNSYFMIAERLALIDRPSGMQESNLFHIQSTGYGTAFNPQATVEADLDRLRSTPGIVDAVQINAIPLSGSGWSSSLQLEPGEDAQNYNAAVYMVDDHGLNTMGLDLVAGRWFEPTEIRWRQGNSSTWPDMVVVTRALANSLFPDLSAQAVVGRSIFISGDQPIQVVGVVRQLQAPWTQWGNVEHAILVPQMLDYISVRYLIRSENGQRDAMMPMTEAMLAGDASDRLIRNLQSMQETRERSYALDSGLSNLLVVVMVVLLLITALGVLGLASFGVRRRTKQIGTRRALGATQSDIMRYFLLENLMITGIGVLLGAVLTVAVNIALVDAMSFPKLHWVSIPVGMLLLLVVGQFAVLGPARRACRVSPAVATRSI